MNKIIKQIAMWTPMLCLATFLVVSISCGGGNKKIDQTKTDTELAPVDTTGAVSGDWIIKREMADAEKLNPTVTNDASAEEIDELVYDKLNVLNYETFEWSPMAASLPEISEDHLNYTYKLKKNVTFSDGKPLTGEDVIFTVKSIKNPFADAAALRNYYESVKKVELVDNDPYTVRIIMSKPYWRALYSNGDFYIMPKHLLDPQGLTDKYNWDELIDMKTAEKNPNIKKFAEFLNSQEVSREPKYVVGSGPYMLEKWETGQAIILKANPNYWNKANQPAHVDKIVYKIIQDNSAALVAAKNKEVDLMYVISPSDFYQNLTNPDEFNLIKVTPSEPAFTYIGWNHLSQLFKDPKVRLALSYLVDRKTINEKIAFGKSVPIQSPVYYKDKKYLNSDLPEIPYDPEKARQLLTEAGWKDSDGDGVLDKIIDGKKVDFKFTFLNNTNPSRRNTLLVVIDALKKVGIQADLQELEWSVFIDKTKKHEFDAFLGAWTLPVIPLDPYQIYHSSQSKGEGSNFVSYNSPESDKLIEQYRDEFDEAKRIEILKKWQKVIYDDQAYTFLFSPKSRYIYDKRFKNTRWYSRQTFSPLLYEWWVPKGTQKYSASMN